MESRLLGPDAERLRAAWGPAAVAWAAELGEQVIAKASQELAAFGGSTSLVEALRRATTSTTLRVLSIISGTAESGASVSTAEAEEGTRDLARRGLKLSEFTSSIRFGHSVLYAAFFDAVSAGVDSREGQAELRRVSLLLFKLIDEFTAQMTDVFLDEQNAWGASRSAAQFEVTRKIIDGAPTDLGEAERLLDYPLDSSHLAVIAWSTEPGEEDTAHRLRSAVEPVLRCWGTPTARLIIPVGSNTVWAWGAFPATDRRAPKSTLPTLEAANVGVGQFGSGLDGFRRTHWEARAVERLVRLVPDRAHISMAHQDVDLDALLLADRQAARQFVARYLGPLGADDTRMKELRGTLRRYLDLDRSLVKVAALENISRNTVTYRVQRAFELCGHSDRTPTVKVRAALAIVEWLLEAS